MLEKCLASGFVLRTAATKPEDYDRNIYHDLRNSALLQRTLFAISGSLAAWPTVKLILISMMTLKRTSRNECDSISKSERLTVKLDRKLRMSNPPKAARPEIPLSNHNVFTLAAVGFLAYYVVGMWHELLGHGLALYLALYLYGARHFVLTSTSLHSTDGLLPSSPTASRIVEAAGSLSTIVLGIALYPLVYRTFRYRANPISRLFLWVVAAIGIFHGFSYFAFLGSGKCR